MEKRIYNTFSNIDIQATSVPMKVGILGTVNSAGLPHLTMISTLQANSPIEVIWGQFTEGLSKQHVRANPKTGFLIMTLDKQVWRGKARWTRVEKGGPEYEMYNNIPMFRYNAYFGVHTVYYMDLVEQYGREPLPMGRVVSAAIQTKLAKAARRTRVEQEVLNPWTQGLLNKLDNLKYVSYVGEDGYPVIIPTIQAQSADAQHVIFSLGAFGQELRSIPNGTPLAVFGMTLEMEDVLLRGPFLGIQHYAGISCGVVRVEWVYNSMPPVPGQIYPQVEIEAVTNF
jgi:hypothetical protein